MQFNFQRNKILLGQRDGKIVGGDIAEPYSVPHQVIPSKQNEPKVSP